VPLVRPLDLAGSSFGAQLWRAPDCTSGMGPAVDGNDTDLCREVHGQRWESLIRGARALCASAIESNDPHGSVAKNCGEEIHSKESRSRTN
jgi:hypothetical protein